MSKHYWLRNMLLSVLFIFACNSIEKVKEGKYYIIIERTSKSLLTNKDEREDKLDSVLAASDETAYDSCIGILYGMRIADSILLGALEKADKKSNYPYLGWKIKGYKIINDSGVDISANISDSVKSRIQAKWNRGVYD